MEDTKCYTFYSYKGGSGRSTTAMNTVYHLISELDAGPANPILVVDVDLESAGLTFYFNQEGRFMSDAELGDAAFDTTCILGGQTNPKNHFKEGRLLSPISESVVREFERGGFKNIEALFKGVMLPEAKWTLLDKIAAAYAESQDASSDRSKKLAELFDVSKFISRLDAIKDKDAEEKKRVVIDFLPTFEYTDISRYFGQMPGTVRFLGVDTIQNKERIARGFGATHINELKDVCSRNNYKAIVFDSGAGTQSSADMLHSISDVLVYCMRPTTQFAKGTKAAIRINKEKIIESNARVILLPTAVSQDDEGGVLSKDCFNAIAQVAKEANFIDATFCAADRALCEVGLFKWREQILGVDYDPAADNKNLSPMPAHVRAVMRKYGDTETLPPDAKKAYSTYEALAKKIVELS
ncbi:MAG: hypothetical protein E7624_06165 [Ruminococcaceae bacterium]|nr:hypothetical protein [Oscillospiraceae bacterium]